MVLSLFLLSQSYEEIVIDVTRFDHIYSVLYIGQSPDKRCVTTTDNLQKITFGSSEMQHRPSIIVFCFRVEVLSRFVFSFEETVVTRDTFRYTVFDNNP